MYKITKVINNNIVCAEDSQGEEVILRGLGIGFKHKVKDNLEDKDVEKVYKITNPKTSNKLQELLLEIPLEYITLSTEIIEYAEKSLNKKLNDNIYITLTDHINFAVKRKDSNMEYKNVLLLEIKRFYPQEYNIGVHSLEIIKDKLDVELSIDEAGFIALHIVNAELNTNMGNIMKITEIIQGVLGIVKNHYKIDIDDEGLDYERFITHLKFFGQRLFNNKSTKDHDVVFQNIVKERYLFDYQCAEKIREFINNKYNRMITNEEMMFLTIHLRRLSRA